MTFLPEMPTCSVALFAGTTFGGVAGLGVTPADDGVDGAPAAATGCGVGFALALIGIAAGAVVAEPAVFTPVAAGAAGFGATEAGAVLAISVVAVDALAVGVGV